MLKLTVKWQKNTYEVEADTSQPPVLFKAQLESLTGVPSERQKIMVKGGMLRDDGDWARTGLKDGAKVMMMGTAEKPIEAPKEEVKFVEDLPEGEQAAQATAQFGAGIRNLGNTCYVNATLQCLYRVPELRAALNKLPEGRGLPETMDRGGVDTPTRLAQASRAFFQLLDEARGVAVNPILFLMTLKETFAQFNEMGPGGVPMQQDAEECWSRLLSTFQQRLDSGVAPSIETIQGIFGVGLESTLTCAESGEEWRDATTQLGLKCNIDTSVNHLAEGLRLALNESREKNSDALGRMANWEGQSKITALPPWLTIQQVRFFYKADVQQKAKILRKVGFPIVLDTFDMCAPALLEELAPARAAWKRVEDARVARKNLGDAKRQKTEAAPMDVDSGDKAGDGAGGDRAGAEERDIEEVLRESGGRPTGRYELTAVLTHKGRSADSGHYVAWCRQDKAPKGQEWALYDDEELTPKSEEDILALCGGGDWHMAYILLYRAQVVPREL